MLDAFRNFHTVNWMSGSLLVWHLITKNWDSSYWNRTVARPNQWQIGLILICMIFTLNWLVLSIFSRWKTQQKKCCTLQCTKITYGKILRSMNSFYRCNFCDLRKWNFQYVRNNNFVIFVVYYRQTTATKHIPHLDCSEKYQNNIFFLCSARSPVFFVWIWCLFVCRTSGLCVCVKTWIEFPHGVPFPFGFFTISVTEYQFGVIVWAFRSGIYFPCTAVTLQL